MTVSMFGFSARMAAGKSSASKALAAASGSPRITFGSVVSAEAKERGLEETRETLQDLGEALVQEDVDGFCARALAAGGWNPGDSIVVDGVRHLIVLSKLREMVEPKYFGLMYLNVDRETQIERWKREELKYTKPLEELEQHPTEIQVLTTLPDYADLVLDGKRPVSDIVDTIMQWGSCSSLEQSWQDRNARRIQLAKKSVAGRLDEDEATELNLLQESFAQYLATQYDPYQMEVNSSQNKLEELELQFRDEN